MSARTSRRTVTFTSPFSISGIDGVQPPGSYIVETEEELIEGLSSPVYRRVATLMLLPSLPDHPGRSEIVAIDPAELAIALERDVTTAAGSASEPSLGELLDDEVLQKAARNARLTMAELGKNLRDLVGRIWRPRPL